MTITGGASYVEVVDNKLKKGEILVLCSRCQISSYSTVPRIGYRTAVPVYRYNVIVARQKQSKHFGPPTKLHGNSVEDIPYCRESAGAT